MKNKNQHFVTEAYIKAWCDPSTPNNGAFVWVFSKKDRSIRRKSPSSLFSESDFYSIYDANGNRILELEHQLDNIENKFISLRDNKLQSHLPLSLDDRKTIVLFISTMFARTKRFKEEDKQIWREYLDFIETLPQDLSAKVKQTREYKDVQELHIKQPTPYRLFAIVNMAFSYLFLMKCAVYEINTKPGLITSDNPCIWFDPAVANPNTPMTFYGLGSRTLNIILPISPKQYISLEQHGPDGYIDLSNKPAIEEELVDPLNWLTVANADQFIVVNQKLFKERWLENSK